MDSYRYPAEWEPHESTWLAWPSNTDTWNIDKLYEVRKEYAEFVKYISLGEKVKLLVRCSLDKEIAFNFLLKSEADLKQIQFIEYSFNDSWIRDYGPDFIIDKKLKILDWRYNAWGGKYPPYNDDDGFSAWLSHLWEIDSESKEMVLEGGSVDLNGCGDLLTTESCLLNKNRNPHMSKAEIEKQLKDSYRVSNVIWLKKGLVGDDTDGHVDDMFRFISSNKVLGININDSSHPDFYTIKENREIILDSKLTNGSRIQLIDLPQAPILKHKGEVLPSSYANFYISNYAVIVPQFGCNDDKVAIDILQSHFHDRRVVGVPSKNIIIGLGSFHCLSKQQPLI